MSTEELTKKFQERVGGAIGGHVEILLAIMGDQHGFFKDLAANGPGSSTDLAQRSNVNERYMREWLNGMVAAKYITYDHLKSTYAIPPENIPVLATDYGPFSMGGMLNLLGSGETVLPKVAQCFKSGGGVPYSDYPPTFWQGLERHTGCNFEHKLLPWLELMDKEKIKNKMQTGVRVCDVGCGRGRALIKLAKQYPKSTFIGYDILEHAVQDATRSAKEQGLSNLSFSQINTSLDKLPSDELFASPIALLQALRKSIKSDGIFECLDIKCFDEAEKNNVVPYGMSLMYCMTTSLSQNGAGLGTLGLTETVMNKLCKEAGFSNVKLLDIQHPFNVIWEVTP